MCRETNRKSKKLSPLQETCYGGGGRRVVGGGGGGDGGWGERREMDQMILVPFVMINLHKSSVLNGQ